MAFPQSFMDELVARSDRVDIVGSYVPLTAKGGKPLLPRGGALFGQARRYGGSRGRW